MVLVCGGLEAVFVLARARQGGVTEDVTVRSLWAVGVLTLALSIFADFVPEVAGPFAFLVLIAMAARSRGQLGQVLGFASQPRKVPPGTSTPGGTAPRRGGV